MFINRIVAFIIGIPLVIIIEIFRYFKVKSQNKKFINYKEVSIVLLFIYFIVLISITLLPFYINLSHRAMLDRPEPNIVPVFNTIKDMVNTPLGERHYMIEFWVVNILGNLMLLAPLSVLAPIITNKFRSYRSVTLLCFSVSLLIESLQYISYFFGNFRSVDIDDVILNTLGALIGFFVFKLLNNKVIDSYIEKQLE
ncbi:VanZ family protein [Clostridium sp. 'White wine YQ']|uniref:VanZ family protein n=1 Tax=Clostridium sp. 'White wine YQ' TaxID=3027474 RepID=UPI0023661A8E|nr:VanZ family protein [Clostridium sp. 'White wine YQ']MDD7794110.1 VanZ family protein [Clostridium sp. 'White wine YQ']